MPNSLKCKIKHLRHNGTLTERECDRILKALEQQPKIGQWEVKTGEGFDAWAECSECGCINPFEDDFNYCPNCGAKMVESEE